MGQYGNLSCLLLSVCLTQHRSFNSFWKTKKMDTFLKRSIVLLYSLIMAIQHLESSRTTEAYLLAFLWFIMLIKPEIEKVLWKNQNGFWRKQSATSLILTIHWIIEGVHAKNLETTLLFVDFSKAFNSLHRGKIEQILLAYGHLKETFTAIMMLYRSIKVKRYSLDGDIDFFNNI